MPTPPASFKTMILDKKIKRADAMKARYADIHIKPGFNLRELDDEYEAGIEELTAHIMSGGTIPALEVVAREDGEGVDIVDGHRRHDAIGRAIARGMPIEWVSVVGFSGNEIDRQARIYTSNKNATLRPTEAARGFKRFRGAGLDINEIAKTTGFSRTHVERYLTLADAERDVQELVRTGAVSADVAIDAVRLHGSAAGQFLSEKVTLAKAAGKPRVTTSVINGRALPRKVVSPLISGVDALIGRLSANQRAAIIDHKEGRVAPPTIEIEVSALVELLDAQAAVQAARERQAERDRKHAPNPEQNSIPEADQGSDQENP